MDIKELVDKLNEFELDDLNNLDWNAVGTWHVGVRAGLWLAVFIAVITAGYFWQIQGLQESFQREITKEVGLKKDFRKNSKDAANLDEYRAQMVIMEEQFGALLRQLPSDTEVPGLIEDIDDRGEKSGLTIGGINLKPEEVKEFYIELPIEVIVTGNYHDFGSFVSGVAGMPRIVTLHDYQIKAGANGLLAMTIQARTYRYKDQEG